MLKLHSFIFFVQLKIMRPSYGRTIMWNKRYTAPEERVKYIMKRLNVEEDENGKWIEKEYIPTDVTWVYGSTEEARQIYINNLIHESFTDEELLGTVTHVDKITKAGNIKGEFAEDETKVLVIHNLKNATINEQRLCRLIDGGCFSLGYYDWNNIHIFPEKVYISADKTPNQVYAKDQFKDRVIRRVTRVIKLE